MDIQPSLNLHAVGRQFVENITGIEEIPGVDREGNLHFGTNKWQRRRAQLLIP